MNKSCLDKFPCVNLSVLPTPLHKLENLSRELGIDLWCKRDDMTGFGFGGNKTRKLDFLIADAINKKYDTLIAVGSNQSNFCRIVAAAGKVNGLEIHLMLGGAMPKKPSGNLLLDHLFGAHVHHLNTEDRTVWDAEAKKLADQLTAAGKKVYTLLFGGSTPIGVLGYVSAFFEIMQDCQKKNITFNTVIHASGSGGTQSGLLVGKKLQNWPGKIIGISVADKAKEFSQHIYNLSMETARLFNTTISKEDVVVDDSYLGAHYGTRTEQAEAAIKLFAQKEGILLDSVYTGKAAAGLVDYAQNGRFKSDEKILFLHTGGNIQLFE